MTGVTGHGSDPDEDHGPRDYAVAALRAAKGLVVVGLGARQLSTRTIVVGRPPILRIRGTLVLKGRVRFRSLQFRPALSVDPGARLVLGHRVTINQGVTIHVARSVTIGDRVRLGDLSCIYDTDFHQVTPDEPVRVAPVVIEDDVWLGRGVLVRAGVRIGRGSVIAAGTIVTRDVPPGSVVAGNPGRVLRSFPVDGDFRRR